MSDEHGKYGVAKAGKQNLWAKYRGWSQNAADTVVEKPILKTIAKLEGEEAAQREKAAIDMVRAGHVRDGFKEAYALDREMQRRILSKLGISQDEDGQSR